MFDHRSIASMLALAVACLVGVGSAHALVLNPEPQCQKVRHAAAAKYTACELKAIGSAGFDLNDESFQGEYQTALAKCRTKYVATWAQLQNKAKLAGTSCDQPRFTVGGGTVKDHLTGLEWEQKTDDDGVHDKDNSYTWTLLAGDLMSANGTLFTSFLPALNGVPFAGQSDWRLPTRAELQTILTGPYPCESPCLDTAIFGPTLADAYVTATPEATNPFSAWFVAFSSGFVNDGFKDTPIRVRAVRGGW